MEPTQLSISGITGHYQSFPLPVIFLFAVFSPLEKVVVHYSGGGGKECFIGGRGFMIMGPTTYPRTYICQQPGWWGVCV